MTFVGGPAMVGAHLWREDKFAYLFMWVYWPIHFLGLMLLWTIARYREYVADRGAALITGAPENLISALVAIEGKRPPRSDLRGGLAVQAFCIVPRRSKWRRFELVMDHPPMRKRIERLEELSRELGEARR
jgi:heat shock protein HtpX